MEPAAAAADARKARLQAKLAAQPKKTPADEVDDEEAVPKAPFSTLSYDVHFVVTKQASVTPTWKLVQVAINSEGTLYAGTRIKGDHLTMTFGPPDPGKPDKASTEVDQQHFARLIGEYVGDAVRGQQ